MLLCLILLPHYFFSSNQGGISNYGTEDRTQFIYILGFGTASLFTLIGSYKLSSKTSRIYSLQLALGLLSLIYFVVLLSTFSYKLTSFNKQLHGLAALALFIAMLAGSLWIRFKGYMDSKLKLAFAIFCLGFIIGLLTLVEFVHLLFTSQIICGACFGFMLTHKLRNYY